MAKKYSRDEDGRDGARDYAGYGPTDGVQSEASTKEADELVGAPLKSRTAQWNICGGNTAKYTRDYDKA